MFCKTKIERLVTQSGFQRQINRNITENRVFLDLSRYEILSLVWSANFSFCRIVIEKSRYFIYNFLKNIAKR